MYLRYPNVGLKCQDHILFWSVHSLDSQNVPAYIERQKTQQLAPLNVKYDDYYGTRYAFSISVQPRPKVLNQPLGTMSLIHHYH